MGQINLTNSDGKSDLNNSRVLTNDHCWKLELREDICNIYFY